MKKRILVIDDEASIRKSFTLTLEDAGFEANSAESGEKGVEMMRANPYDLILLDLKMPGMDGIQTLRKIRTLDQKVPVYLITAFHQEFFDQIEAVRNEGIEFELMRKPIGGEQLVAVAKSILEGPASY
jgi:DNA-binding response OmpR family regulator